MFFVSLAWVIRYTGTGTNNLENCDVIFNYIYTNITKLVQRLDAEICEKGVIFSEKLQK